MRHEAWALWKLGGLPVAVAQLEGHWSVVAARKGAAGGDSLDAAYRAAQSS